MAAAANDAESAEEEFKRRFNTRAVKERSIIPRGAALKKLTVARLRALLASHGLPTAGRKDDLVRRLNENRTAVAPSPPSPTCPLGVVFCRKAVCALLMCLAIGSLAHSLTNKWPDLRKLAEMSAEFKKFGEMSAEFEYCRGLLEDMLEPKPESKRHLIVKALEEAGCPFDKRFITAERTSAFGSVCASKECCAYFKYPHDKFPHGKVVMCLDHDIFETEVNVATSYQHMEQFLIHELVHAYDSCRFSAGKLPGYWPVGVIEEMEKCACREVRAYNLDGGCRRMPEYTTCVADLATFSVESSLGTTTALARKAVDAVFQRCVNVTCPLVYSSELRSVSLELDAAC